MKPQPSNAKPGNDLHEAIRRRAEEIYHRKGRIPGRDLENWAQAEQEVWQEAATHLRRKAVIIKINGIQYIGEYTHESAGDYAPGEFLPGMPVEVRFLADKMFVRRPDGRELETTVVQKIVQ